MGGLLMLGVIVAPPVFVAGIGGLIVAVRQDRRRLRAVAVVPALWLLAWTIDTSGFAGWYFD